MSSHFDYLSAFLQRQTLNLPDSLLVKCGGMDIIGASREISPESFHITGDLRQMSGEKGQIKTFRTAVPSWTLNSGEQYSKVG